MAPFQKIRPLKIDQFSSSEVTIQWNDGHNTKHSFRNLRLICQCAICRDEMTGKQTIEPNQIPTNIHPLEIKVVGSYALNFHWSDGHSTGIYPFNFLRAQDEHESNFSNTNV